MEKEEVLLFLEELKNNKLISDEYKNKIQEISEFIKKDKNSHKEENSKKIKSTILSICKNSYFNEGEDFIIYTDGGCIENPGGNGGYGVVILHDGIEETISKGFISTTNNRMELRGPIEALKNIPEGSNVTLYSDSKYFCNAVNQKWIDSWLKNNWKNGTVKNIDLWKEFISLYNKHHIEIFWVEGHAGNEYNEECDRLATEAYLDEDNLEIDEGYENN